MAMQLRYYVGMTKEEIKEMTDEDFAKAYAMLTDIRKEQAKQQPFAS